MSLHIEVLIDPHLLATMDHDTVARLARRAARLTALARGFNCGEIGIRVTDDPTIQQINRRHLDHDYPTDVISFGYQSAAPQIAGELVVSMDTAYRQANQLGWDPINELTLYIVHGVLHLTGLDDLAPQQRSEMRTAEAAIMTQLGAGEIVRDGADSDQTAAAEQQS